ncbi:MAG: hypothetical protein ACMXYL_00705 [Candidatus Woesearchaeota archaeon]
MTNKKKKTIKTRIKDTDSKNNARQHTWVWILIILSALAIIFLLSISNIGYLYSTNINDPICRYVQIPYEAQESYLRTEYYVESVPYTHSECEEKDIPYSIESFRFLSNNCNQVQEICNKFFLGICTEKTTFCIDRTVSCTLDLTNLDSEERGYFTVRFNFFEQGSNNYIKHSDDSRLVYAQTRSSFSGSVRIISEGEDGDANKQLSCNHVLLRKPTKTVCRDVIQYRDVQRERQVTAYRPITKYRSEQICD